MGAGKIQPFDPKAFDRARADVKQRQAMDAAKAAALAKAPKRPPPAKKDTLTAAAGGLRARRDLANQLAGKGKL